MTPEPTSVPISRAMIPKTVWVPGQLLEDVKTKAEGEVHKFSVSAIIRRIHREYLAQPCSIDHTDWPKGSLRQVRYLVPAELSRDVKRVAAEHGATVSKVIRRGLSHYAEQPTDSPTTSLPEAVSSETTGLPIDSVDTGNPPEATT